MAAKNLSVTQFQQLMDRIPQKMADKLRAPVFNAAEELADTIKLATPLGIDGRHELLQSIRVEEGKHPLRAVVLGGGALTKTQNGYDYSLSVEHGNERVHEQPFFYPTYRLMKKKLLAKIGRQMKPILGQIVKIT